MEVRPWLICSIHVLHKLLFKIIPEIPEAAPVHRVHLKNCDHFLGEKINSCPKRKSVIANCSFPTALRGAL